MFGFWLQESADRERKSRLFARDRNSSSSVGKSSKKPDKIMTAQGVLSPSQVQADNTTIAEVCVYFKSKGLVSQTYYKYVERC